MPPPLLPALLPEIAVSLLMVMLPLLTNTPPPVMAALLPEMAAWSLMENAL